MSMNLRQMFSMQPPTRDAMARRLTGGAPLRAPDVSTAPIDFHRFVNPPHNKSFRQNSAGAAVSLAGLATHRGFTSLDGFGGLSGDPAVELVPGVNFLYDIDKKDFITDRAIHKEGVRKLGLSWDAVTPGQVTAVRNKLQDLTSSTEEGANLAQQLVADGADYAAMVGKVGEAIEFEAVFLGARGEVDVFGKVIRKDVEANRLNAMRKLKAWMAAVIATPTPEVKYTPGGAGTPGATVAQRNAAAALQKAANDALLAKGPSKMPLYVGGALIALLGVVVVIKKRKA